MHLDRWLRLTTLLPLIAGSVLSAAPIQSAAASSTCQFASPTGGPSAITHAIHIQFDNVHFSRDLPNVPSDLEQMPHLLNFIENNGALLANDHTPLIAHTTDDLVTGMTGVYGDQHGLPVSNSFEYYNNSALGSFNTSAFTYWTDKVSPPPNDAVDAGRQFPLEMIDSAGNNLPAPWVPFVKAGCNFGAVSTANMVLENGTTDVTQVFGSNPPPSTDPTNDFVGIAVHCADTTCSTVHSQGNTSTGGAALEPGTNQGFGALFGHVNVAQRVSNINCLGDCQPTKPGVTAITGFRQANGFNPTAAYTLGYLTALLQANVPVVYGEIADAHDSGKSCAFVNSGGTVSPAVTPDDPTQACGAFAPGEPGYVAKLKSFDNSFAQFFTQLNGLGINQSNTLFVFHSDENDHYTGSQPINMPCDGITTPCKYDRTKLGEITTDLPLLLKQQNLYDFGMVGGSTTTTAAARPGFTNTDLAYGIDFDTAPGFWLKGQPPNGSAPLRKLEGALAKVTAPNLYSGNPAESLFRYFVDAPGLKALHMVTSDPNRTPGVIGFGAEDHFNQTNPLISPTFHNTSCNQFPGASDATCLNQGFIWLHGNYAEDVNHTWAAIVGPGVSNAGVDSTTWADHTDLRPTMMTLLCLKDSYSYEGRALLEDIQPSALPSSVASQRDQLIQLGQAYKQLNAPVGDFGKAAIALSTVAIRSNDATYTGLEALLQAVTAQRDQLAGQMQGQLGQIPGCGGLNGAQSNLANASTRDAGLDRGAVERLRASGEALIARVHAAARGN